MFKQICDVEKYLYAFFLWRLPYKILVYIPKQLMRYLNLKNDTVWFAESHFQNISRTISFFKKKRVLSGLSLYSVLTSCQIWEKSIFRWTTQPDWFHRIRRGPKVSIWKMYSIGELAVDSFRSVWLYFLHLTILSLNNNKILCYWLVYVLRI